MKKAVIGVMPLWDRDRDSYWMLPGYLEGLELAGALPITLPLTEDTDDISRLVSLCDGFLFTGGQDVSPELYGEKSRAACGEICEKRDAFEQRLFAQALEQDKPMLGDLPGHSVFQCLPGRNPLSGPAHGVPLGGGTRDAAALRSDRPFCCAFAGNAPGCIAGQGGTGRQQLPPPGDQGSCP